MSRVEPNRNVYVGHRYVPKIFGEWDKQNQYEGLSIVTHQGNSYTSKKRVPVGIDILNEEYWVVTGNYNAQVEDYRQEVRTLEGKVTDNTSAISDHDTRITDNTTKANNNTATINNVNDRLLDVENGFNDRLEEVEKWVDPELETLEIKVPGDFSDLQSAFDHALKIRNGTKINIVMQTGYNPSKGIFIEDSNAGHIKLSSVDDVVTVSNDFTGHFIYAYKSIAPLLNCLIDMNHLGQDGLRVSHSSLATINPQCGVINAGVTGIYARTSTVTGSYSKFMNAGDRGLWATRSASVSVPNSDFSGANGTVGIYASRSSNVDLSDAILNDMNTRLGAVQCLRSKMTLLGASINNSQGPGILAGGGAEIVCRGVSIKNAKGSAVVASGGRVALGSGSDLSNAGEHGIHAYIGGVVGGVETIINDATYSAIQVEQSARVALSRSTISRSGSSNAAVFVTGASHLELANATVRDSANDSVYITRGSSADVGFLKSYNSKGSALRVSNASNVSALSMTSTGAGTFGVVSENGSMVSIRLGNITGSVNKDLMVQYGGHMTTNGCTTTNGEGQPALTDVNVDSFNSINSLGIMYR